MASCDFLGTTVSGPFTILSGLVMASPRVIERLARIPALGILTTKSISLEPKKGYATPIVARCAPFSLINAVGLANPGAK